MKVVSVHVGQPRAVPYRGREVMTGIFKQAVRGRVAVVRHHVDGDRQADLTVHGGPDKAVYAYPAEHYPYWSDRLGRALDWGAFGENLTTTGLVESDVYIGDRYRVGTAILAVTQPRRPCFKLAMKLERDDIVTLFGESGRSGFHLKVVEEGNLAAGDAIERMNPHSEHGVTVADVNRLHMKPDDAALLARVLAAPELSASQRDHFEHIRTRANR